MQEATQAAGWGGAERRRVETLVDTLAGARADGESLAELAHDARNMVTALGIYCDLLEEPGVLAGPFVHYGSELRLVAAASLRLVEKLVALDPRGHQDARSNQDIRGNQDALGNQYARSNQDSRFRPDGRGKQAPGAPPDFLPRVRRAAVELDGPARPARRWDRWEVMPALPVENFAAELMANRNLLAALAGPTIALTLATDGGALPVQLTGEDLTRVLVNLVKNAAEAMPAGGRIRLSLSQQPGTVDALEHVVLSVEDTGTGIDEEAIERIFEAGFSAQFPSLNAAGWPSAHRGLGLSISRSIIESAGGTIVARNSRPCGARFQIEMPVRKRSTGNGRVG